MATTEQGVMEPALLEQMARELGDRVDWDHPGLSDRPFAAAWREGRAVQAALGLVRHLRRRRAPKLGYTAGYIARLRAHAPDEFRRSARAEIDRALHVSFQGGRDASDGRETLLAIRPEVLQVAGQKRDFDAYAVSVARSRAAWEASSAHAPLSLVRFIQAAWPLRECTDEAMLPVLAFLALKVPHAWTWARTWDEHILGSTGHNWWLVQFGPTWEAGLFFPEFKGMARFQALFPEYFEREMSVLIFPDGFTHECSTSYHTGTVDLFADVARVARLNGLRFSAAFDERLRRAAAVEWKLMTPDGSLPAFGDCFVVPPYSFERLRSVAAIYGDPHAKWLAETMDAGRASPFGDMLVEALHYPSVGEDLRPAYDRLKPRPPAAADQALTDAHYYVMRRDWSRDSDYAAIEAGTRGNVTTSHGHTAVFDLSLYSRGRAITVGNGKGPDVGLDNPARAWRVSTPSHTVAGVDGLDNVPIRSIYRFERVVLPTIDDWRSERDFAYFSGAHEGYERLEQKVSACRRKLFYLRGAYWILIDRFTTAREGDDEHAYRQHFQMAAPCAVIEGGRVVTSGRGGNVLFVPVEGTRGEPTISPCPHPLEGYSNPDQLVFTHRAGGRFLFVTVIVPFLDEAVPDVDARLLDVEADEGMAPPWEITGLAITINGRRDVYVDQHMQWNLPWQAGGCRGTQRLFHSRVG